MTPQALPAGTTLIVAGGRVILPDADWHRPAIADIAIAGPTIAAIAPAFAPPAGAPVETLDARGHLVLPGFVNAHYHSHDVLAKGTLEEVPLEAWRLYALPPQYPPRSLEEVRARTLLGALECLRSGMTTVQDMLTLYPFEDRHLETVMEVYDRIGIPVVFALQYADRKGLDTIPLWKEVFPEHLPAALGRGRARAPARSRRSFRDDPPQGAATAAPALGARPLGARTLLSGADRTHHGARAPLRHPGLFPHL